MSSRRPSARIERIAISFQRQDPRNNRKKFAKCCFIYDEASDMHFCPMGNAMPYRETKKYDGSQGTKAVRIYACKGCEGCPLAKECLDAKAMLRGLERYARSGGGCVLSAAALRAKVREMTLSLKGYTARGWRWHILV